MATKKKKKAAFVLDDRSVGQQLDAFRLYSQRLPYGKDSTPGWPQTTNWAQVILGYEAGAWDPLKTGEGSPDAGKLAWSFVRENLVQLYGAPDKSDGQLPPERAFLLALLGLLETPQALLNQLPAQYQSLYYRQMLALEARAPQPDRLTVSFTLAEGVREQVLPAGLLLDAGQDSAGTALRYALEQAVTVNAARVTDLRWVVRDPSVPGGRRARIVLDDTAGQPLPEGGVRLFDASPAGEGAPHRVDADRLVASGRIVGSPVLAIAGGQRKWTVTLASALAGTLRAAISIGEAWVPLACSGSGTEWTVTLDADGGIPAAVTTLDNLVSAAPLLRLTNEAGEPVPPINTLSVSVSGATNVHCARDDGTALTGGGMPFGEMASVGSGVNMMSPEWWRLGAMLKTITVTPTWAGLPDCAFSQWYGPDEKQKEDNWLLLDHDLNVTTDPGKGKTADNLTQFEDGLAHNVNNGKDIAGLILADKGYPDKPENNDAFKIQFSLMQQGHNPGGISELALFNSGTKEKPSGTSLSFTPDKFPSAPTGAPVPDDDDPVGWPWRIRMALTTSFLQSSYAAHESTTPQIVNFVTEQKITQQVPKTEVVGGEIVYQMVDTGKTGPDGKTHIFLPAMKDETTSTFTPVPVTVPKAQWHPPYIPQWSGLQVDYEAEDTSVMQRVITPFGYASQDESLTQPAAAAEIYLGVEGIAAGQQLTLHWQLKSPAPLPLDWQYLAEGERWASLPASDGTGAWQRSGIWSADWPGDASLTATSLPAGKMWLRGRARNLPGRDPDQVMLPVTPLLLGLATSAGLARLTESQNVAASHFDNGLPALQVTQALDAPETLSGVVQPWPSYGGLAAETPDVFGARVARRLRHRERGLNNIDLMMLLQEQYPDIRELAVLPPVRDGKGTLKQTIVVMPGQVMNDSRDEMRPGLSAAHLADMVAGLKAYISPWLTLTCVNPEYIPVNASWLIDYTPGLSRSAGDARVRAALEAAFVPWVIMPRDDTDPVIGQTLTRNAILGVLSCLPEVERIVTVWLNGDDVGEVSVEPNQVGVLKCIPPEYTNLALTWLNGNTGQQSGEVTLIGDGRACATVLVTLPKKVQGPGAGVRDLNDADVYLVDLDTGQRVPTEAKAGMWAKELSSTEPSVQWDRACYADPRRSVSSSDASFRRFNVGTAAGASGIHRLGVAVGLKVDGIPDMTLQSVAVGESVTLRVRATTQMSLWHAPALGGTTQFDSRVLAAPVGWNVTLDRYVYFPDDQGGSPDMWRFIVPVPMSAETLSVKTGSDLNKTWGLRPITPSLTPHAVVGGGAAHKQDVVLWYINPSPDQAIGLDVGSTIGEAALGQAVSFTPEAGKPQQLTFYALRLNTAMSAQEGKTIGEVVDDTSSDCPVTLYDVGLQDGTAFLLPCLLAMDKPVVNDCKKVQWTCPSITLTPTVSDVENCHVAINQYYLQAEASAFSGIKLARLDIDQVSQADVKSATEMGTGKGLLLAGGMLTSLRGHSNKIHLWWVDPEPGLSLGLDRQSTIGTIALGEKPITFTVSPREPGKLAIYEMQLISDASPTDDPGETIGHRCTDHCHGTTVGVYGKPGELLTTIILASLTNGSPAIEQMNRGV